MLKAILIATLGGMIVGRTIRNGWLALVVLGTMAVTLTGVEAVRHHFGPGRDAEIFAAIDTIGAAALFVTGMLLG